MKIFKFFAKSFLALILLTLICWTVILGTLQTNQGQEWVFNQFKNYFEQTTQTQIQIKKIHYTFPLSLSLEEVILSQNQQPIIAIQTLNICCAYAKVLQGKLVFNKLQASHIDIFQIPSSQPLSQQKMTAWEAPLFPFYVKMENVDIQNLRLNSALIDALNLPVEITEIIKASVWNVQGMMSNNPFRDSMTAHLLVTAKIENSTFAPFTLGMDTQNHQLSLSFHFNQLPLNLVRVDLPSTLKTHFALYASAPVSTWQNMLQNPTQESPPIEGHFKLTLQATEEENSLFSTLVGENTVLRSRYLIKSKQEMELVNLKIENPSFFLKGKALLTSDQKVENAIFKGEIKNLERFQTWLGKELQGQLTFDGHAAGSLESPSVVLRVKSPQLSVAQQNFQNITSSFQTFPHHAKGGFLTLSFDHQNIPWKMTTSLDWAQQQRFTLSHLKIEALGSRLQGNVTCYTPEGVWEGLLEAQTKNLTDISHFLTIPLKGEGQLKVELAALVDDSPQKRQGAHLELIGKSLSWMEWQARQFILHLHVDPLKEKNSVFHIQTNVEGEHVQWKEYVMGHCTASTAQTMDFTYRNFDHLSTEWQAQDIQGPQGKIERAAGHVHLQHPLEAIEGNIQFTLQNLQTSTFKLEELAGSTTFHPTQNAWPFNLKGHGVWKEDVFLATQGTWHYQKETFELHVQHLSGKFGPYPLQLLQPAYFLHQPLGMEVANFHLRWGDAELQAHFKQEQQNIFSQFKTNAVPSELFHFIVPDLPLAGRATFQGHLEGPIYQPQGHFQIDLHHIQITEDIFTQKPFIAGRLLFDLDKNGVELKSEIHGIGHTPLLISGHLPFTLSLDPFNFKTDSLLPFNLALNAEGELDPYLHLFYNDTTNLSGHAKIALRLNGQIQAPQIRGNIDLINGAYESLSTGALYHNIQAHLEGDGSKILLTKFSAQDNKNGSITATGAVNLDASNYFPFEFQIHPARIFILDSDYASISASGPLSLKGNSKQSKLQGELTIHQGIVRLEEALPQQIKNVDMKYINLSQEELKAPHLEKKETVSALEVDVKLNASQQFLIQGNRLKSNWKGVIYVTGSPDNPQLHGDLRIVQGEYDFNGKIFNLSQGNIHFAGAPDKKTSLYVVASKEIDRITAEIIVKGAVNKPVISFRSNPPLSQREVLSYILFNRGISDITSDQGDQLSQSFISLNSSEQPKSGDDFLSRLRNNMGIDRLDFTTNDTENKDIGLQVGKNITENIFISVNQSMTSLTPIIAVEAKLRKNLKAQAEAGVGEDTPIRMSLKWKKDY